MVNKQLLDYIKQQLGDGVERDVVRDALIRGGWNEVDVDGAFSEVGLFDGVATKVTEDAVGPISTIPKTEENKVEVKKEVEKIPVEVSGPETASPTAKPDTLVAGTSANPQMSAVSQSNMLPAQATPLDQNKPVESMGTPTLKADTEVTQPKSVPEPAPINSVTPMTNNTPQKRSSKAFMAVMLALIGLLLIGGGVFAYVYYAEKTPEQIMSEMSKRLFAVTALSYEMHINTQIVSPDFFAKSEMIDGDMSADPSLDQEYADQVMDYKPNSRTNDFFVTIKGKTNLVNVENPQASFGINLYTDALEDLTNEKTNIGAEIRVLDKTAYIQLSGMPNIGIVDLSFLDNQWVEIKPSDVTDQMGTDILNGGLEIETAFSSEDIETIKSVLSVSNMIKVTEVFDNVTDNGVEMYHYGFVVDKDAIKEAVVDLNNKVFGEEISDVELADLDEVLGQLEKMTGEIWIGKTDLLPHKISMHIDIEGDESYQAPDGVNIEINLGDYNEPVKVEVPTPVKSIDEILKQLFMAFLGGGPGTEIPTAGVGQQVDYTKAEYEIYYSANDAGEDSADLIIDNGHMSGYYDFDNEVDKKITIAEDKKIRQLFEQYDVKNLPNTSITESSKICEVYESLEVTLNGDVVWEGVPGCGQCTTKKSCEFEQKLKDILFEIYQD